MKQSGSKANAVARGRAETGKAIGKRASGFTRRALDGLIRVFWRCDAPLLDLLEQGRSIQSEQAGGAVFVPVGVFESLFDEIGLEVADDGVEIESTRGHAWRRALNFGFGHDVCGKIFQLDLAEFDEHGHSLNQVLELANVTGPVIVDKSLHRLVGDAVDARTALKAGHVEEMMNQQGEVAAAVSKGWDFDRKDIQAVVEVLAESTFADELGEILMRGRDDSDIDLDRLGRADRLERAFLEHPQQFDLEIGAHVTNLVEKDGTPVGDGETTIAMIDGVSEGTLYVAEEFGFE